ncbi:MAG: dihydroorotate dehydrogenase electron transfer subunit [Clostridia bacterium]
MEPIVNKFELIKKAEIRKDLFDFTVYAPEIAKIAVSGQFLHIKCGDEFSLRRPISICEINAETIRFIFEIRGDGTDKLSKFKVGDFIDILGPLGNGFEDRDYSKKAVFVGGGIGIFPLLDVAKKYKNNATVLLGFKDKASSSLISDFENAGCVVKVATDDGSLGINGFVTDYFKDLSNDIDTIYACGPSVMIKKTATFANDKKIKCLVSLEERMGCGIGACLVCACKTKDNHGNEGYSHVCKNGPIFDSKEVVFDD